MMIPIPTSKSTRIQTTKRQTNGPNNQTTKQPKNATFELDWSGLNWSGLKPTHPSALCSPLDFNVRTYVFLHNGFRCDMNPNSKAQGC